MTEQDSGFARFTNAQLIRRMENAPDFGYDDEEAELTRRLKLGRQAWRWSGDFFRPRVEIYEQAVILDRTAEEWHTQLTTNEDGESTGHLATPASRYGRNSQECAWYAVAALAAYSADAHEPEGADAFLEYVMRRVVNDDEEVATFLREHQERIPEEVRQLINIQEER